jgi:hypothetical protein
MHVTGMAAAAAHLLLAADMSRAVDLRRGEGLAVRKFLETASGAVHPSPASNPLGSSRAATRTSRARARVGESLIESGPRLAIEEGFSAHAAALRPP